LVSKVLKAIGFSSEWAACARSKSPVVHVNKRNVSVTAIFITELLAIIDDGSA
jgi:hypothetical protein